MLMWVRVGSASLRSAALPGGREAKVSGAARTGTCAPVQPGRKAVLGYLPNTSSFLKQRPHSIRAPVICDRGCLKVQKGDKPSEKITGGTDRIPKDFSQYFPGWLTNWSICSIA